MEQSKMMSVGCKIVGKFGKKKTANLFLGMGAALCIAAIFGAIARQDMEVSHCRDCIACHFTDCLFCKATEGTETDSGPAGENIL